MTIVGRRRKLIANLTLLLLSLFVASPLLGETLLRTAILLNISRFRNPDLYADYFSDDDYWKLHHRWVKRWNPPQGDWVHALLGWAPPKTPANPLGVVVSAPYTPDFHRRTVLFYGDSFVGGLTPMDTRIPQQLDDLLPEYVVYNYGVGGYGVDQIYLRLRTSHSAFHKPIILFGILTEDLDRCLLTVRTGPKPYFTMEDDSLVLRGVPIDPNPREWLARNPPRIRSYLVALIRRQLRLLTAGGNPMDLAHRRTEKERINARIIEEVIQESRLHDLSLLFVIFYSERELRTAGWRELFLKGQFARWRAPYVDTKDVLLRAAQREPADISEYYRPGDGHLNERGNRIVAEGIAEYFQKHTSEDGPGLQ